MTTFLDLEDLVFLAEDLQLGHVRDYGLLEAAAMRPATTLIGTDAYPTLRAKAAALLHSIVCNHALFDGNKRLGWHAATVFLGLNGLDVDLTEDESFDLTMAVASGELRDVDEIAARLKVVPRRA